MILNQKLFSRILIVFCLQFLFVINNLKAQDLPDFKIRLTNGKIISSTQLPAKKPVIIIVFSPDCSHCKILIDGIFKKITSFKKAQLIMATFVSESEIRNFEQKYKTANYSNIIVGSDVPVFFFQKYYKLTNTPYTVLYDKNKKWVASYKNEHAVEDLIKQLNSLH